MLIQSTGDENWMADNQEQQAFEGKTHHIWAGTGEQATKGQKDEHIKRCIKNIQKNQAPQHRQAYPVPVIEIAKPCAEAATHCDNWSETGNKIQLMPTNIVMSWRTEEKTVTSRN